MATSVIHGTSNAYTNHACRCGECRAHMAAYMRQYLAADPERRARHNALKRRRYAELKAEREKLAKP